MALGINDLARGYLLDGLVKSFSWLQVTTVSENNLFIISNSCKRLIWKLFMVADHHCIGK